jgi:hypothetical protein
MSRLGSSRTKIKRGDAHDEEDDGKSATHAQEVSSESVRWALDTFGAVIVTIIHCRKERNRNGECQDPAWVISNILVLA